MPLSKDLLYPSLKENRKHKKSLLQSPSSYFMDVKCPGCYNITTIFSYAQTAALCVGCSAVLCQPTGGKARLTKDTPSERSSTKSTLYQEEWRAIPINTFWIEREREILKVITGSRNFSKEHQDFSSCQPSRKSLAISFRLPAIWWSSAVVLELWSLERQHQRHQGTC